MPDSNAQDNARAAQRDAHGAGSAGTKLPRGAPTTLGRFEIRAMLGEGAFGRVYRGYDNELRRDVAIKVPHTAGLNDEFRERFLREARAIAAINHPNVCPIWEVGTDDGMPFIVMRFVAGTTLANIIDGLKTPMPPRNAVAIVRKLALGMAAAHTQGVTHRDLKPANVLFETANREVLITDFGLASVGGEMNLTARDTFLGTPAYTSPEQANRQMDAVGPLSDVYSLGVILYEMLTGDVPFNGSVMEVAIAHCVATPDPPSKRRPGLDPNLDAIVLKTMAKKPAERYPSAKGFADALTEYLRTGKSDGASGSVSEMPAIALGGGREPEAAVETVAETAPDRRTAPAFEVVKPPPPAVVELDEEGAAEEAPKEARRSGARKSDKQSKNKKKRAEKEEEEVSPAAALLKNKMALAGIALGVVALVLFVVCVLQNRSKSDTVQKPAPDPVTPPVQQPQPHPQPKVEPKVDLKAAPKLGIAEERLRLKLLEHWKIQSGAGLTPDLLKKMSAQEAFPYIVFRPDGSAEMGVTALDPIVRIELVKNPEWRKFRLEFRVVSGSEIEFTAVPPDIPGRTLVKDERVRVTIENGALTILTARGVIRGVKVNLN